MIKVTEVGPNLGEVTEVYAGKDVDKVETTYCVTPTPYDRITQTKIPEDSVEVIADFPSVGGLTKAQALTLLKTYRILVPNFSFIISKNTVVTKTYHTGTKMIYDQGSIVEFDLAEAVKESRSVEPAQQFSAVESSSTFSRSGGVIQVEPLTQNDLNKF